MKKILLSTIVLLAFTVSILLFQISCKKEATAQSPSYVLPVATTSRLGGVMPDGTTIAIDGTGKISATGSSVQQNKIIYVLQSGPNGSDQLWTVNYDGTGQQLINITLPTGLTIANGSSIGISPDRKSLFFAVRTATSQGATAIYGCNTDGSNVHKVANLPGDNSSYSTGINIVY
jgi:hypothetical protein